MLELFFLGEVWLVKTEISGQQCQAMRKEEELVERREHFMLQELHVSQELEEWRRDSTSIRHRTMNGCELVVNGYGC